MGKFFVMFHPLPGIFVDALLSVTFVCFSKLYKHLNEMIFTLDHPEAIRSRSLPPVFEGKMNAQSWQHIYSLWKGR